MADHAPLPPHPHIGLRGGFVRIVEAETDFINTLLHGLKDNGMYTFGFNGLKSRYLKAESLLEGIGLPEFHWDGIIFSAYTRGPAFVPKGKRKSKYGFNSFVGIGVKVQRRDGEWVLIDAFKTGLSSEESGEPHFQPFTSEQWAEIPEPDDNPYHRRPDIKFTVKK